MSAKNTKSSGIPSSGRIGSQIDVDLHKLKDGEALDQDAYAAHFDNILSIVGNSLDAQAHMSAIVDYVDKYNISDNDQSKIYATIYRLRTNAEQRGDQWDTHGTNHKIDTSLRADEVYLEYKRIFNGATDPLKLTPAQGKQFDAAQEKFQRRNYIAEEIALHRLLNRT